MLTMLTMYKKYPGEQGFVSFAKLPAGVFVIGLGLGIHRIATSLSDDRQGWEYPIAISR